MSFHVLHVVESWHPEAGAVSFAVRGLIRALKKKSVSSSVYPSTHSDVSKDGVEVIIEPESLSRHVGMAAIVHFHGWRSGWTATVANTVRKAAKPYIIAPLGGLSDGPYMSRSGWLFRIHRFLHENRCVTGSACLIAQNEKERAALAEERVHADAAVLPYGWYHNECLNPEFPEQNGESSIGEKKTLLILGPIHPIEGFVPFLKAFAEIGAENENWDVAIAGPEKGEWREMLAAAIRRKGARGRVRFDSCPDLKSQHNHLRRATMLACPSLHYRAPVSIMHAIDCGVPVMASDRVAPDGLDEVADVCRPNRKEFRETLRVALGRSGESRDGMAAKARAWSSERLDWDVLVDRYVRLYRDLM